MSVDVSRRNFLLGRPTLCRTPLTVAIGDGCLARQRIVCRSCHEACEAGAIRMAPAPGGVSLPDVLADRCTGCGDCLAVCPASAIQWSTT